MWGARRLSPPVHGFSLSSLVEQVGKQLRVDSLEVVDGSLCITARPGAMSREERDVVVLELQRLYEREVAALRAELQLAREKGYGKSVLAEELDRRLAECRYDLRRARWKLRARRRSRWARLGEALGRLRRRPGRLLLLPRDLLRVGRTLQSPRRDHRESNLSALPGRGPERGGAAPGARPRRLARRAGARRGA